jgi:hypothetical protein
MTLIELMVAMALATVLVGTAAFVFIESQKIMTRVDTRLKIAQAFRVTSTVLDSDGAHAEPAVYLDLAGAKKGTYQPRKITGGAGWFTITADPAKKPGVVTADKRADTLQFVTHANVSVVDASSSKVLPPSDHTVRVTVQYIAGRGIIRTVDLLTVTTNPLTGAISATVDNSTLPNNQGNGGTAGIDMELAPGATGFAVRWNAGGGFQDPPFAGGVPNAIELTVFLPEEPNRPDTTRLSLVKVFEVLAPPP